jgi:hypothetical protein
MKALPMNASNFPLGILLLAAGLVLLLREHRSSVLEVEVLELRRKLSTQRDSTSSSTMENERSLRSGPKRVPPQPPYPLTQLDLERRSSTRPDHDNAGGDSGGSRSSGIAASSAALLPYVVPKKTFSDDTRLVFFAGIEGTGHHFWTAVFDDEQVGALATPDVDEFGPVGELWQLAKQGPQLCNKACDNANGDKASASGGGVVHSPKALKKSIADLVGKLSAATSSQPVTTTVVPLNAWKSRGTVKSSEGSFSSSGSDGAAAAVLAAKPAKKRGGGKASLVPEESRYGMMSFPNWWEPEKTLKHPNLRLLSEASEAAQADLRVVVLLRNSKDVLHSTAVKRASAGGFSLPLGREAAILADNTVGRKRRGGRRRLVVAVIHLFSRKLPLSHFLVAVRFFFFLFFLSTSRLLFFLCDRTVCPIPPLLYLVFSLSFSSPPSFPFDDQHQQQQQPTHPPTINSRPC